MKVISKLVLSVSSDLASATVLTIASGAITVTGQLHRVDTEGSASTDDLVNISGGTGFKLLYLRPNNSARTVVIKHGTGNIKCFGNIDITLDDNHDFVVLLWDEANSTWCAMTDAGGGGGGTTLPVVDTTALVSDPSDPTKRARIDVGYVGTGQTRILEMPDGNARVRGCLNYMIFDAATPISVNTYWLGGFPMPFTIEDFYAVTYDSSGSLVPVDITVKVNGGAVANLSLGTGLPSGAGQYGGSGAPPHVAARTHVLTVTVNENGAGSAGTPAYGLWVYLTGYWGALL